MVENNEQSDLEKFVRRAEEYINCEVPKKKCSMRGDYWRCYMGNYTKCSVYIDFIKNKR